ncbi:MAG: 2-oxo-4-hydroxy-4-carboxy-5-ureidoimidazoline decarboxylase [Chloroflexi bacterium]|nr:2-oxo-4-hydroxy-4-carboxy-5-ureidoimidazoline decarboxylase [Chloroflexota bacterium]MBT6682706.1 2-oxo-4-hydroxy-4-carboxy-5-ureidoimidazoline decarboxylase [Chloroflexota bacterium]
MTQEAQRFTISVLNDMNQQEFVDAIGQVFEYAPGVAANTWDERPFETVDALHEAMLQALKDANREDQLKFLRGHTDMQVTPEAIAAMTPDSQQEHIAAGFDKLTEEQQQRIDSLVKSYKTRFGFPFIAALRGRNATEILALAEQHLGNDSTDMELYFTFTEIGKITRMRLDKLAV